MATVFHWSGSWASAGDDDLLTGKSHWLRVQLFRPGDVISLTAFPITGNPFVTRTLTIKNLRTEGKSDGLRIFFDVADVVNSSIPAYFVT